MEPIRIAACILILPDGRVVLQRRDDKAPTAPNKLGFFGGHIEDDDIDHLAAAQRELSEETSLPVENLNFQYWREWDISHLIDQPGRIKFYVYKIAIENTDFAVYEGVGSETYLLDEVLQRSDLVESAQIILKELKEK